MVVRRGTLEIGSEDYLWCQRSELEVLQTDHRQRNDLRRQRRSHAADCLGDYHRQNHRLGAKQVLRSGLPNLDSNPNNFWLISTPYARQMRPSE